MTRISCRGPGWSRSCRSPSAPGWAAWSGATRRGAVPGVLDRSDRGGAICSAEYGRRRVALAGPRLSKVMTWVARPREGWLNDRSEAPGPDRAPADRPDRPAGLAIVIRIPL